MSGTPVGTGPAASSIAPFRFRVGGHAVLSDLPLPGYPPLSGSEAEGAIRIRHLAQPPHEATGTMLSEQQIGGLLHRVHLLPGGGYAMSYAYGSDRAEFRISADGTEITLTSTRPGMPSGLIELLEGLVLGNAMRLAGMPLLHANLIAHGGRAVALMGGSGAGKTSLSWALIEAGAALLSEDAACIQPGTDGAIAHPGRTRLRLWPDTAARLGLRAEALDPVYPEVAALEKRMLDAAPGAVREAMPVHAIYCLQPRRPDLTLAEIAEAAPAAALGLLAANVYGTLPPDAATRRAEMAGLARLAEQVPVHRLTLPDSLEALPAEAARLLPRLFA